MKAKTFYLSLSLLIFAAILFSKIKSTQAYWYDYIDPFTLWSYLGSWGLQDIFLNWLQNYSSAFLGWATSYYGWDILYWLLEFY